MGYWVTERGGYCWSEVSGRPLGRCDISTKSWGMRGTSDAKIWRKSMARTATRVLEVATGWWRCSAVTVSDPGTELGLECSFPALCSFCSPSSVSLKGLCGQWNCPLSRDGRPLGTPQRLAVLLSLFTIGASRAIHEGWASCFAPHSLGWMGNLSASWLQQGSFYPPWVLLAVCTKDTRNNKYLFLQSVRL